MGKDTELGREEGWTILQYQKGLRQPCSDLWTWDDPSQLFGFRFGACVFRFLCQKLTAAAAAKSLQLCPTLCHPRDGSPPGSPVPGILQARTLEWVAISCSNAWKWKVKVKSLSHVRLLATPWTAAHQDPPSLGFSRQEYWGGLPLPSPQKLTGYRLFLEWGLTLGQALFSWVKLSEKGQQIKDCQSKNFPASGAEILQSWWWSGWQKTAFTTKMCCFLQV